MHCITTTTPGWLKDPGFVSLEEGSPGAEVSDRRGSYGGEGDPSPGCGGDYGILGIEGYGDRVLFQGGSRSPEAVFLREDDMSL